MIWLSKIWSGLTHNIPTVNLNTIQCTDICILALYIIAEVEAAAAYAYSMLIVNGMFITNCIHYSIANHVAHPTREGAF